MIFDFSHCVKLNTNLPKKSVLLRNDDVVLNFIWGFLE